MTRGNWIIAGSTVALYLGAVAGGLHVRSLGAAGPAAAERTASAWTPPSMDDLPAGAQGQNIRMGMQLFRETAIYAPQYTRAKVSCGSCHAEGGIQPYASPLVGLATQFPMYSKRAGHMISLPDRIEECFVRSENGRPLPYDSPEMQAITAYIGWLSKPEPGSLPFAGRGLLMLPAMPADAGRGAHIYAEQCAGCHGEHGEGMEPLFPPLWGADSFNDGAGMNDVRKMASFVRQNMPQNRPGILSAQDAFDVSAYIHEQSRPHFNQAYSRY